VQLVPTLRPLLVAQDSVRSAAESHILVADVIQSLQIEATVNSRFHKREYRCNFDFGDLTEIGLVVQTISKNIAKVTKCTFQSVRCTFFLALRPVSLHNKNMGDSRTFSNAAALDFALSIEPYPTSS